jgi:hypothetical protein
MVYFDDNDSAKDYINAYANYDDLLKEFEFYNAALEASDKQSKIYKDKQNCYETFANYSEIFKVYQDNLNNDAERQISSADKLQAQHFYNMLQSLKIKTALLHELTALNTNLMTITPPSLAFKKCAKACYDAAVDLAYVGILDTMLFKGKLKSLSTINSTRGATPEEMELLTTIVKRTNNLYENPFDPDNHIEFSNAISYIPAKQYNFNWPHIVDAVCSFALITLFVFMTYQLIAGISLLTFATSLVGMANAAVIGTRVPLATSRTCLQSPYQFFHNEKSALVKNLQEFSGTSKRALQTRQTAEKDHQDSRSSFLLA